MVCLQGLPQGKVYSYNPATKETHLLARGFFYSNGIAVSEDGSYLVLSETDRLRLLKIWLKGAKVSNGCPHSGWNGMVCVLLSAHCECVGTIKHGTLSHS